MICRLCLNNLNDENCIPIFDIKENNGESTMVKMIAKYLYLEITQSDSLSTQICTKCYQHLDDFQNFCDNIEQQQKTLNNEFFELAACDNKLDPVEANDDAALFDMQDMLEDQMSAIIMKIEIDETSADLFDKHADKVDSAAEDIPLKYLQKCEKSNELLKTKADTLSTQKPARMKKIDRIKLSKKTLKKSNTKDMNKKMETTTKRKQPTTTSKVEMNKFITSHMQMKCNLCENSFEKFSDVRPHFKEVHISKRPSIMCCGVRFRILKNLYEHVHWHLNPEYFKCKFCEQVFKNGNCLNLHIIDQHEKSEESCLRCPHCPKTFSRSPTFEKHVQNHKAERNYACKMCNKSFTQKHHLNKHVESVHENIYLHICDFCGQKFKYKLSFEKHVLEHKGVVEPPAQCKVCHQFYKNKRVLRHHMNYHNTNDVKCKYCGHESTNASTLQRHIYNRHIAQLKHQCTYCDKVFKTKKSLLEHVATHTGQILYNCQYCSKNFRFHANMYVHVKRQHPQEWSAARLSRAKK